MSEQFDAIVIGMCPGGGEVTVSWLHSRHIHRRHRTRVDPRRTRLLGVPRVETLPPAWKRSPQPAKAADTRRGHRPGAGVADPGSDWGLPGCDTHGGCASVMARARVGRPQSHRSGEPGYRAMRRQR